MSDRHKNILLTGNAAIAAGDHEGFLSHCAEDTVWEFVGEQTLRGKEAVRRWMQETYSEPPAVTVENLISEGKFLIAQGEVTMKNAEGKPTTYAYCDVWRFENDQLAALKAFVIDPKAAPKDA